MRAAREFAASLDRTPARIVTELFGSLALTGRGHGTDRAILLGLSGEQPDRVDPESIGTKIQNIQNENRLDLLGTHAIPFQPATDIQFRPNEPVHGHPNTMRFTALDDQGGIFKQQTYYSIGGGFIVRAEQAGAVEQQRPEVPYPFTSAADLLEIGAQYGIPVWAIMLENEKAWRPESEIRAYIQRIWSVMQACVERGLRTEGILPGGLNVRRRAPRLYNRLQERGLADPLAAMDWVNLYAMAVNEENAAGGRVVTAPTNGAAGVIPAVAHYYWNFVPDRSSEGIFRYFLTAAAIGVLYKENASISGAEVGCQGEVGVACSMAAAGLTAALEGSNEEIEQAAEIGMEHNLGMTCDPIGGLVQIPCIERNAIGAVKAINASRMAMGESGEHKVTLDQVIKTMYETGLDMQSRYKETSLAGLAVNVVEC
jgi:L-serine dehydratase